MSEPVDIPQVAFPAKDLLRPFAREAKRAGEGTEQLDYLCNMVIVFAVFGPGLGVEEVVACY